MKTQLTIEDVAPYSAYNLQILVYGDTIYNLKGLEVSQEGDLYFSCQHPKYLGSYNKYKANNITNPKLILRPLSDLTKEIEVNGERFVPTDFIKNRCVNVVEFNELYFIVKKSRFRELPYWLISHLLSWHFDVFGLIEKGLAVDINTLKQ